MEAVLAKPPPPNGLSSPGSFVRPYLRKPVDFSRNELRRLYNKETKTRQLIFILPEANRGLNTLSPPISHRSPHVSFSLLLLHFVLDNRTRLGLAAVR
jgi:hypothetical protein